MVGELQAKKALVTGGTGFVGSHLVRRLITDGWQVSVLVRPSSNLAQLQGAEKKVRLRQYDGTVESVQSAVSGFRPDVVFHLASCFVPEHQPQDIEALISSNLLLGAQLLEAMKQEEVGLLLNTGTSWQHFQDEAYNPVNLYAATKQAFEDLLRFYLETTNLKVITLKLFDTYGPDDPRPKLVSLLKRIAETGETLEMSPGEQLVDLVHVDDVVAAYLLGAERLLGGIGEKHEQYAVSSGAPVRLQNFVRIFEEALGRPLPINWGARAYRAREVMVPWSAGQPVPGWSPRISLSDGIRALVA